MLNLPLQHPDLAPPDHLAFGAVQRELRVDAGALDLQHVFVIPSLALDREGLELARRAHRSRDHQRRGTALEYLESVLPEPAQVQALVALEGQSRPASDQPPADERAGVGRAQAVHRGSTAKAAIPAGKSLKRGRAFGMARPLRNVQ
jgi:hypothetical protein